MRYTHSPATRYQNNATNEIHNHGLKSENGTLCLIRHWSVTGPYARGAPGNFVTTQCAYALRRSYKQGIPVLRYMPYNKFHPLVDKYVLRRKRVCYFYM